MEGDTLKGTFTRKDNGKMLITTRKIIGDELVQVNCCSLWIMTFLQIKIWNKCYKLVLSHF